jgi:hypothetical protein
VYTYERNALRVVKLQGTGNSLAGFVVSQVSKSRPGPPAKLPYAQGIQRTIAWFEADPRRKEIDEEANASWDTLISADESGLEGALRKFRP